VQRRGIAEDIPGIDGAARAGGSDRSFSRGEIFAGLEIDQIALSIVQVGLFDGSAVENAAP
jgi:hypothetical protein